MITEIRAKRIVASKYRIGEAVVCRSNGCGCVVSEVLIDQDTGELLYQIQHWLSDNPSDELYREDEIVSFFEKR